MGLQNSGRISLQDIVDEFGGTAPHPGHVGIGHEEEAQQRRQIACHHRYTNAGPRRRGGATAPPAAPLPSA